MFERASDSVKTAVSRAAEEAARRGDRRVGTDHLLLGLLHDPTIASRLGADVEQARAAAQELDRAALAALGIDLNAPVTATMPRSTGHAPLTSDLRAVMSRAFIIAKNEHTRKVEPQHLLQALLERKPPDPAAALLEAMNTRPEDVARAR